MQIIYTSHANEDRKYWEETNPKIVARLDELIVDIIKHPFSGLGKPEALRFEYSGYWSRRINNEHRLVYKVNGNDLYIIQCRYNY